MKRNYLTWAGVIAAGLLVVLFVSILLTGTFTILPSATIDPIADRNTGDLMVITGTTNLPLFSYISLSILPASQPPDPTKGRGADASIARGSGMTNTWSAAVDTTDITPGDYRVDAYQRTTTNASDGTFRFTYSDLLASSRFRLDSSNGTLSGPGSREIMEPFITVNEIGKKSIGDKFLVSGTTSLPPDTDLLYAVIQQSNTSIFTIDTKTRNETTLGGLTRTGIISVSPGIEGINRWSFALDTTRFIPDKYQVVVTLENTSAENIGKEGIFGTAYLTLRETPSNSTESPSPGPGSPLFITVDTPGTRHFGERFTITGTTNLPAGDDIMVQITPSFTSAHTLVVDPKTGSMGGEFSGIMGGVPVVRGTGGINLWSMLVETATLKPTKYEINASTYTEDPVTRKIVFGNVSGTAQFTLES
jgi:hypothetical protein